MPMNDSQRKALERLWFVFGNHGAKHTWGNHKFIQELLDRGIDDREFFRKPARIPTLGSLTTECETAVDTILNS
jgi:hypothetical protein